MKSNETTPDTVSDNKNLPTAGNWEGILKLAWRPAWSMRSRKGCLAPFIAWLKRRDTRSERL